MMKLLCVCFAGVPGSGKTGLAYRLSWELGLPIFSSDAIRNEIRLENNGILDVPAFDERRERYGKQVLARKHSFIYDGSVDRRWSEFKQEVEGAGYDWLLISLDLSSEFRRKLNGMDPKLIAEEHMVNYHKHHDQFLDQFGSDIALHITDETFEQRFELALSTAKPLVG
jgi:hypothetical protein